MCTRTVSRIVSAALAGVAFALSGAASAHSVSVAHVSVDAPTRDGPLAVAVDLSLRDLELALALDADGDSAITWAEVSAQRDAIADFVLAGIVVGAGPQACTVTPGALRIRRYADGAYASLALTADCAGGARADTLSYSLLFDVDAGHRALVAIDTGRAGDVHIADATHRTVALTGAPRVFAPFLREGVHHILIGADHLAFLVSLLLAAALLRRGPRWEPVPRLRVSLTRAAAVVTAFTVAHSVTLSLAALDIVRPAPRWVESAIAASVVIAALNNVWPVITRRHWLVAFAFGLVHGFGFAGALGELGLPAHAKLTALVAFNLGVELGQLGVVALLLPVLHALRRWPRYPAAVMRPASLALAGVAAYWFVTRVSGA
jgi:hypothetical protein